MENNKKSGIFDIKTNPKKQKEILKELSKVSNLKSAIHFVKNNKKYIKVNRKFKAKAVKFSIATVASISSIVIAMSLIKTKEKDVPIDIKPLEPTIVMKDNDIDEVSPMVNNEPMEDYSSYTKLLFPKASHTNEVSDLKNYNKVKDRYGAYIDKVAKEYGVDSRIITAMIAQENPNGTDITRLGTYGPMCVTSIHNGVTYSYGHYVNGEFVKDNVTIDINALKDKDLYQNGEYGNITKGDALCIEYGTIILKDAYSKISKANDNLTPEEVFPLAIAAYNHGYPDVIRCTKNASNLSEASYSIRYTHAKDSKNDDDQYIEDVFNKISKDDLKKAFTFVDNNGNSIDFNLQRNDEVASISSEISNNYKRAI